MGVIAAEEELGAANGGGEPRTFWRRIAQTLDRLVAQRSRQVIPAIVLRRSKYDHDRCRRLMVEGSISPLTTTINRVSSLGAERTAQQRS